MKGLIFAIVSGSLGALVGLLFTFLTGSIAAIFICAVLGVAASLLVQRIQ